MPPSTASSRRGADPDSVTIQRYNKALSIVQSLPPNSSFLPSNEEKLQLYGLYKQASIGDCDTSRPGIFDMIGRAKWDAWHKLKDMSQTAAMEQYVQTLLTFLRRFPDRPQALHIIEQFSKPRLRRKGDDGGSGNSELNSSDSDGSVNTDRFERSSILSRQSQRRPSNAIPMQRRPSAQSTHSQGSAMSGSTATRRTGRTATSARIPSRSTPSSSSNQTSASAVAARLRQMESTAQFQSPSRTPQFSYPPSARNIPPISQSSQLSPPSNYIVHQRQSSDEYAGSMNGQYLSSEEYHGEFTNEDTDLLGDMMAPPRWTSPLSSASVPPQHILTSTQQPGLKPTQLRSPQNSSQHLRTSTGRLITGSSSPTSPTLLTSIPQPQPPSTAIMASISSASTSAGGVSKPTNVTEATSKKSAFSPAAEKALELLQTEVAALNERIEMFRRDVSDKERRRRLEKSGWSWLLRATLKQAMINSFILLIIFLILWRRKSPIAYALITWIGHQKREFMSNLSERILGL